MKKSNKKIELESDDSDSNDSSQSSNQEKNNLMSSDELDSEIEENNPDNEDNVEIKKESEECFEEEAHDDNSKEDEVRMPVLNPLAYIKNKEKRKQMYKKLKNEKSKIKRKERKERRKAGIPSNPGHTIESLREKDQTTIAELNDSENEELQKELEVDEFSSYFAAQYVPKILVTFSDNPCTKTRKFGLELSRIIPNTLVKVRNRSSVKKIVKSAEREGFTDVLIVNEDCRKPNGLLVIHLPKGPTFHFKLSNVKLTKDIKRNHNEITKHRPEVILTNFTTKLGLTVGRMFGSLFNHDPQFKGRRVATFHNQRDFIFFRHHRYEFGKDGKRAKLRELGPRFTLKLRSIQEGTFDSKTGDYSWIITNKRHSMEGRRRFFL